MADTIKADDIALVWKKLNDSQKYLKQKNVYLSLLSFKEALEKRMNTAMLVSDQKDLDNEINLFQQNLFGSKTFKDTFGPVSFQDNEQSTLLQFVCQLIKVQDQDLIETVQEQLDEDPEKAEAEFNRKAQVVMELLEKGDLDAAKRLMSKDERLSVFVANTYNSAGISSRERGEFDKSISEYMMALVALPEDEGLYYNMARARYEKGELDEAVAAVKVALKINPQFKEGNDLLRLFIHKKSEARKKRG